MENNGLKNCLQIIIWKLWGTHSHSVKFPCYQHLLQLQQQVFFSNISLSFLHQHKYLPILRSLSETGWTVSVTPVFKTWWDSVYYLAMWFDWVIATKSMLWSIVAPIVCLGLLCLKVNICSNLLSLVAFSSKIVLYLVISIFPSSVIGFLSRSDLHTATICGHHHVYNRCCVFSGMCSISFSKNHNVLHVAREPHFGITWPEHISTCLLCMAHSK